MRLHRAAATAGLVLVLSGCTIDAGDPPAPEPASSTSGPAASPVLPTPTPSVASDVVDAVTQRVSGSDGLLGEPLFDIRVESPEEVAGADTDLLEELRTDGVVASARQRLQVDATSDAIRSVVRFGSAADARADLDAFSADLPDGWRAEEFEVAGRDAVGFDYVDGEGTLARRNVGFVDGAYEYVLGFAVLESEAADQPTRREMARALASWADRVAGLD